jgi:DNA-binding LacI/PurR family transcriptional regulator
MKVTIRDIARQLNLSIGAVSRALDGYPDISEETRRRVRQTALEMGYVPNQAARHLRRKRADAIGYILPAEQPRFTDPFFSEFVAGLGDETAHHGVDLVISTAPPDSDNEKWLYLSWVQGRKVDGVILNRLRLDDWRVSYLVESGCPFASLEKPALQGHFNSIEVDNCNSIAALVMNLQEHGFQRIAYIGGPADLIIQAERLAGYQQGLSQAGFAFDPLLVTSGDLTSPEGFRQATKLLRLPAPPDAIICINDETAFGAMHAVTEAGLLVGQQVGVTGFDGVQSAAYSQPPLTTLDQPIYDIAKQLVQMLLADVGHKPISERRIVLIPKLLWRQSTQGKY